MSGVIARQAHIMILVDDLEVLLTNIPGLQTGRQNNYMEGSGSATIK